MKRDRLLILSTLALIASSLSGCASPIALATSTPETAPTATAATQRSSSITLEDCVIGNAAAQCGTYRVYENRSAHSGRQIDLKIAVLPATGDHVKPDPLFYFAGGPGGAATDVASMLKTELSELNKTRDIVLIDQRGTGGSNLLHVPHTRQAVRRYGRCGFVGLRPIVPEWPGCGCCAPDADGRRFGGEVAAPDPSRRDRE